VTGDLAALVELEHSIRARQHLYTVHSLQPLQQPGAVVLVEKLHRDLAQRMVLADVQGLDLLEQPAHFVDRGHETGQVARLANSTNLEHFGDLHVFL
jgi:hypothetical protein